MPRIVCCAEGRSRRQDPTCHAAPATLSTDRRSPTAIDRSSVPWNCSLLLNCCSLFAAVQQRDRDRLDTAPLLAFVQEADPAHLEPIVSPGVYLLNLDISCEFRPARVHADRILRIQTDVEVNRRLADGG